MDADLEAFTTLNMCGSIFPELARFRHFLKAKTIRKIIMASNGKPTIIIRIERLRKLR